MIQKEMELMPKEEAKSAADEKDVECGSHLKKTSDLTGFPVFPPGTKSLLCKHLSKDIWSKYKDQKDKFGYTFKEAILSGCQNVDSGIGLYAGSHDSYTAFADLFDKVVETYHDHKKADKHVSNMDYTKLNTPPFTAGEARFIKSTRVRVGRNLADYPLGPGLSDEQRNEIMDKVTKACSTFEGELKGTFYPLKGMDKDT